MFKHNLTAVLNSQRKDKKGRYPLRIRSTIKRKVSYFPTGIMLLKTEWSKEDQRIINHADRLHLNEVLTQKISEKSKEYLEQSLLGEQAPLLTVRDFFKYAEGRIKGKPGTVRQKHANINKFKKFRSNLKLNQITPDLLYKYEDYCRSLGNKENSVWKSIKEIKTVINAAHREGLIKTNPFNKYKGVRYVNPERVHLTAAEINKLEKLSLNKKVDISYRRAATWFLFCCYSGLRYSDALQFDKSKISQGKIILRTEKSGSDVSIKVHPKLKSVIQRIDRPLTTNQDYNRSLKAVANIAKINKPLTSHVARHSFAVSWLNNSGSLETLSKLMGHNTIRVTELYGKITNKRIDAEVEKVFGPANKHSARTHG